MKNRLRDEEGASLLLVIIFVMVFGVVIGSVLDFASAGFETSRAVADVRGGQLAVDGAMDGAINAIRGSLDAGLDAGDACTDEDFFYDGDPTLKEPDVTVTCVGLAGPMVGERATMPDYAVLTLSPNPCHGFLHTGHTPSSEHEVTIKGGLFSNGRIAVGEEDQHQACGPDNPDAGNPFMTVLGGAHAVQGCTPWDEATGRATRVGVGTGGIIDCDAAAELDPLYAPAVGDVSAMVADPTKTNPRATCTSSSTVVVFSPGLYTEHPLSIAARGDGPGNAACDAINNDVWWFRPGVYYFDLVDDPATNNRDESLWDFAEGGNTKSVVGGALAGGLTQDSLSSAFRFGVNPLCLTGPGVQGVQFIFGGATHVRTQSSSSGASRGDVELCGATMANVPGATAVTEKQQIVVYGIRADQDVVNENRPLSTTATATTVTPGAAWLSSDATPPSAAATTVGGAFIRAPLVGDAVEIASASFQFPSNVIPAGSRVTEVRVRARHAETGDFADEIKPTISITHGGVTHTPSTELPVRSTFEMETNFSSSTDPASYPEISAILKKPFRYEDVNDLRITYTADGTELRTARGNECTGTGNDTVCPAQTAEAQLDALVVEVKYVPPGFNALNCPGGCKFLTTTNNPGMIFRGTVYTPTASYDVSLQNGSEQLFQRGLIAWDVIAHLSPSSNQTASPFQLPGFQQRRLVLFEASVGSDVRLRAKVEYSDDDATPGREVEVLDWVVVRS